MTEKPLTRDMTRDIMEKLRTGHMTSEEYTAALPDMTLEEFYLASLPADPAAARVLAELHLRRIERHDLEFERVPYAAWRASKLEVDR